MDIKHSKHTDKGYMTRLENVEESNTYLQYGLCKISSKWTLLDDGSPTSTNLGNDHGFISEEY